MIIADTNVVSELMPPSASERVQEWIKKQRLVDDVYLTTINVAARAFAPIAALRRQRGRAISIFDAQIAAIAHANDAALATRNTADFEGCGIRLTNPWVD